MDEGWFIAPVQVTVGITGSVRSIASASQADALLGEYLKSGGSIKLRAAHHACRAAMSDPNRARTDAAREAFIEAAREVHLIRD
jgi:hypothetical protein